MSPLQPDAQTTFLVSGGARGITARCVIQLAEQYHCRFILLGRSAIAPEPEWAAGVTNQAELKRCAYQALAVAGAKPKPAHIQKTVDALAASREIQNTLSAVAAAGGQAEYLSVDITHLDQLRAGLAPIGHTITGLIHGAGVLSDKLIENKTEADFEKVYAAKVQGLVHLLECIPASQLQYLVLFASVAGFYGNIGQADYAIANEVLNKTAHLVQHQHPGCRVLAVNWGPWDGGMVTPELKQLLAGRQVPLIPLDQGATWLADVLATSNCPAQVVVGQPLVPPAREPAPTLQQYRLRRRLTLEANPFLHDHVIGGKAVLPTVCAIAWMTNACEQLYPGYTFFQVEDYRALKGIVFDDTLAEEYILDLAEIAKAHHELVFEGRIWSVNPAGKPRYHYSAKVTLVRELSGAASAGVRPPDLEGRQPMAGLALYTEGTLFHGPAFRGIDRVLNFGSSSLTTRCCLAEVSREKQGQFPVQSFNPYLADAQLQSLLIWAQRVCGYGGLPLRIQRGERYLPVAFGEVTYTTLEVCSHTEHTLVANVTVHDEMGRLSSRVTGAEITLSPRLVELFKQNRIEA